MFYFILFQINSIYLFIHLCIYNLSAELNTCLFVCFFWLTNHEEFWYDLDRFNEVRRSRRIEASLLFWKAHSKASVFSLARLHYLDALCFRVEEPPWQLHTDLSDRSHQLDSLWGPEAPQAFFTNTVHGTVSGLITATEPRAVKFKGKGECDGSSVWPKCEEPAATTTVSI